MTRRGFTLIEIMLVIIIIGILASMVMPRFVGRSEQARVAVARADIEGNISTALDMFEMDNGRYPNTSEGLASLRTDPGSVSAWKGPYLKKDAIDPWARSYLYKSPGSHESEYDLYSSGPNGIEGDDDDIKSW